MLTSCTSSEEENTPYLRKFGYNITKNDGWRYIEGVRRGLEYTVILVSGKIMKPADIAKTRKRMTSKNWRQFLIKTLECVMMAATNHSSLNKFTSLRKTLKIVLLKTSTSWVISTGKETSSRICSRGFFLLVPHAL